MGNAAGEDAVVCLNALTGAEIWKFRYPCQPGGYPGPRATPVIENKRVYTLSREGLLLCLDLGQGTVVWQANLAKELGAKTPGWGFSGSPLVQGDLVIANVGSAGCAVKKADGSIAWKSGGEPAGYAGPVVFEFQGKPAVALFGGKALLALDAASGAMLWQYPWETSYDVNAADPIVLGTRLFITSGYGRGANLLDFSKVENSRPAAVYASDSKELCAHFSTPVLLGGDLYGIDGNTGRGQLRCVDPLTGKAKWTEKAVGFGALMVADGKLIIQNEKGELIVAEASPAGYKELARGTVLGGTCWTMPVLANGRVYCRNDKGNLACVEFVAKPVP
jgi:outer membrane protein assembly factor BamB